MNDSDCDGDGDPNTFDGPGYCRFVSENARWECAYTECVGK